MKMLLKNKLLKVVSVLLVFSVCFCSVSMDVFAAEAVTADFVGQTLDSTQPRILNMPLNDSTLIESHGSYRTYQIDQHIVGSFDATFYNNTSITPFDCTKVNYDIGVQLLPDGDMYTTYNNLDLRVSLIISGLEYPITPNGSNWLIISTALPHATHIVVHCEYEYDVSVERNATVGANDENYFWLYSNTIRPTFRVSVSRWNAYNEPDRVAVMAQQIDELVYGNEGLTGAINHQTSIIQQGNNLQQQANNMQANTLNDANNAFAGDSSMIQSGISGFNNAEETLQNYSMQSLEQFDFDSGELASVGVGMVAAFTWISSFMEHLYTLTEFSPVFNIVCTLTMACVFLGFRRLWSGK